MVTGEMDFKVGKEYPDAFDRFQRELETEIFSKVSPKFEYLYSVVHNAYNDSLVDEKISFVLLMVFEGRTYDEIEESELVKTSAEAFGVSKFVHTGKNLASNAVVNVFNGTDWGNYPKVAVKAYVLWEAPEDEEMNGEVFEDSHKIVIKVFFNAFSPQEENPAYRQIGAKSMKTFNLDWAEGADTDKEYPDAFEDFIESVNERFGDTSDVVYSYVRSIERYGDRQYVNLAEYCLHFALDFHFSRVEQSYLNEVLDEMDVVFCNIWRNANSQDCKYLQEKFNDEFAGVLEATKVVTQRIEPKGDIPDGVWVNIYFNVLS